MGYNDQFLLAFTIDSRSIYAINVIRTGTIDELAVYLNAKINLDISQLEMQAQLINECVDYEDKAYFAVKIASNSRYIYADYFPGAGETIKYFDTYPSNIDIQHLKKNNHGLYGSACIFDIKCRTQSFWFSGAD